MTETYFGNFVIGHASRETYFGDFDIGYADRETISDFKAKYKNRRGIKMYIKSERIPEFPYIDINKFPFEKYIGTITKVSVYSK